MQADFSVYTFTCHKDAVYNAFIKSFPFCTALTVVGIIYFCINYFDWQAIAQDWLRFTCCYTSVRILVLISREILLDKILLRKVIFSHWHVNT